MQSRSEGGPTEDQRHWSSAARDSTAVQAATTPYIPHTEVVSPLMHCAARLGVCGQLTHSSKQGAPDACPYLPHAEGAVPAGCQCFDVCLVASSSSCSSKQQQ